MKKSTDQFKIAQDLGDGTCKTIVDLAKKKLTEIDLTSVKL